MFDEGLSLICRHVTKPGLTWIPDTNSNNCKDESEGEVIYIYIYVNTFYRQRFRRGNI